MTFAQALKQAGAAARESGEPIGVAFDPELTEHNPDSECYGFAPVALCEKLYASPVLCVVRAV